MVFVTEDQKPGFAEPDIEEVLVGHGGFAEVLVRAIEYVGADSFFHILGDHWLGREVADDWYVNRYDLFVERGMDVLRIDPPDPYKVELAGEFDGCFLHRLLRESPYLSSFQPAFYRRDFLLSYLNQAENPWDNETKGTQRIRSRMKKPVSNIWLINERIVRDTMRRGEWINTSAVTEARRIAGDDV